MKLVSLNVGMPQEFTWQNKNVFTSIFKSAVEGKHYVTRLNIQGDYQSDQINHGGINKAVYSYDLSYYPAWKAELPRDDWKHGMFGENLTTTGLTDDKVFAGNVYKIGTVMIRAVQPRFPCFKLNIRFGRTDMIDRFYGGEGFGTYFRVEEEGVICAGDAIELIEESKDQVSISDITFCKTSKGKDQSKLVKIIENKFIPEKLKDSFRLYLK